MSMAQTIALHGPPLLGGWVEATAQYVQKAWLGLAVSRLPDHWSSEPATSLCVLKW